MDSKSVDSGFDSSVNDKEVDFLKNIFNNDRFNS